MARDLDGALVDELVLAAAVAGRLPQPTVGLAASAMLGESLAGVSSSLSLTKGADTDPEGNCFVDLLATGGRRFRVTRHPSRTVVVAPATEGGPALVVLEVEAAYELGGLWHGGHAKVHDPHAAAAVFPAIAIRIAAAGLMHEAAARSEEFSRRRWYVPDLDRQHHAATRLGVLLARAHGHLPPLTALDDLHRRAACLDAAWAIDGAARLFERCAGDDDAWHVPGLRIRSWKGGEGDVLALVSMRGQARHASVVTWSPSASVTTSDVTVGTMTGDGPREIHGRFRRVGGGVRLVGDLAAHEHAAIRLLGQRVEAALRVVDALEAVHELHAILGIT